MGGIDLSVKIANYKCFGAEPQGFDQIKPINLVVGRNNAGKSALLDAIENVTHPDPSLPGAHQHRGSGGATPKFVLSKPLEENELRAAFSENTSGGGIRERNHWIYGKKWIGVRATWSPQGKKREFISMERPFTHQDATEAQQQVFQAIRNPLAGKSIRRIHAERNILPEEGAGTFGIDSSGTGATRMIEEYLHSSDRPGAIVEEALLGDLNMIFRPDAVHFDRIITRRHRTSGQWEVYLEESGKGQIPLSHSGSGLKTVILTLCFVHLLPHLDQEKNLSKYIFIFEELENSLHPALQRRLALYLRNLAVQQGVILFLSTHSSATIDLFSADPEAQIVHVSHDGRCATATTVTTYIARRGILDDLDIRASDLLQANCVIWVEGPTDRLYFNRWLELWAKGRLREGVHYQCVFYGGRLLKHLTGEAPDLDQDHGVHMLSVNRNAVLLIDSDKRVEGSALNETKQRLIREISGTGGIAWVTAGREIENYVPAQAVEASFSQRGLAPIGPYEAIGDYLEPFAPEYGAEKFDRKKVAFAEAVCTTMTREGLATALDLAAKLDEVVAYIDRCNGTPPALSP